MNAAEIKKCVRAFIKRWQDHESEISGYMGFWIDLLQNVYGVSDAIDVIKFQKPVKLVNTCLIDGYIAATRVLIEHKSSKIDLSKKYRQSDETYCTPYEQAKRYANALPYSEKPRFIVCCNYQQFWVYDQENPQDAPYIIELKNLEQDYPRLSFLANLDEVHLNRQTALTMQAGTLVGRIYDALHQQYQDKDSPEACTGVKEILCKPLTSDH